MSLDKGVVDVGDNSFMIGIGVGEILTNIIVSIVWNYF